MKKTYEPPPVSELWRLVLKAVQIALEDLGFVQQCEIFDLVRNEGTAPPVLDARDVLQNPERSLRRLCEAIGIAFDPAMLSWPAGLRETDGIWAKHWYDAVAKSTSFERYKPREGNIPHLLCDVYEKCQECYERLYELRLK